MRVCVLLLLPLTSAGCGDTPGSCRCSGNAVECYRYDDDERDDVWMKGAPCADGSTCKQLVLHGDVGDLDWAVCATEPDPSPQCEPANGRVCTDDHHMATCLGGHLDAEVEECWSAAPDCFEPEPGRAFCVASTQPSPMCAGAPTRSTAVCASGQYNCAQVDMQQACLPGEVRVLCYGDVLIETTDCSLTGGTCAGTNWANVSACRYGP